MSKQSKEEFLCNVKLHAEDSCAWGALVDWSDDHPITVKCSNEMIKAEQDDCRVDLDPELKSRFEKLVKLENNLIDEVRMFNALCREKLERNSL